MLSKNTVSLLMASSLLFTACMAKVDAPITAPNPTVNTTTTSNTTNNTTEQTINFQPIVTANVTANIDANVVATATNKVISTMEDLTNYWHTYVNQTTPPPAVDFNNQCVVAVVPGNQTTSTSTSTTVASIKRSGKHLKVQYRTTSTQTTTTTTTPTVGLAIVPLNQAKGDFDDVSFEKVS